VKIRRVEYAGTVATPDGPRPGTLPQVAFSGRSNVGKSSLINALLQRTRSKLAHVSATPGKTQALNFYRVNDRFFLVDLPGFGYARVPAAVRERWKGLIEGYLSRERSLKGVVHLVDARHGPMKSDLQMLDYLGTIGVPVLVVLTKIDKLKARERERALERATTELAVDAEQILPFSSRTGEGRDALLDALEALLGAGGDAKEEEAPPRE
jgi:GTP-binding protein